MWARQWWYTPLIPAFRRQRQADLCKFEANLIYKADVRTGRTVTEKTYLEKPHTHTHTHTHTNHNDKMQQWYHTSFTSALGRQRQGDL